MKKALILALALFLNTSLCFAYSCEKQNGRCTEYYSGTKIVKSKFKLKEGKIEGEYREFFQNKNLKILANYKSNVLEGEYLTYYDNSQLKTKEFYRNGQKHGISYLYNPKGTLLNSTTYFNGKKQGYSYDYLPNTEVERFWENDEISLEKEYTYDDKLLKEKRYFKNGDLKTTNYYYTDISSQIQEITSAKRKREQLVEIFQKTKYMTVETLSSIKNRKITETTNFYNNDGKVFYSYKFEKLDGKIISAEESEFTDYGNPIMKKEFTNYIKKMKFTKYHPNGRIAASGQVTENPKTKILDFKEGDFYRYNIQGKMTSKITYKNNKEMDSFIWNYHPNGNYSLAGRIKNGEPNGIQILYYDNGKPEVKSNFSNGKLHGKSIRYDYEGRVTSIENYVNGVLNGEKTTFYRNGSAKTISTYKNGKLDGAYSSYYENGKLKSKGTYLNNKSSGFWVKYYKNGKVEADCNYKNGEKNGTCKKYWENGNHSYIDIFEHGTLRARRAFSAQGEEIWSEKY